MTRRGFLGRVLAGCAGALGLANLGRTEGSPSLAQDTSAPKTVAVTVTPRLNPGFYFDNAMIEQDRQAMNEWIMENCNATLDSAFMPNQKEFWFGAPVIRRYPS